MRELECERRDDVIDVATQGRHSRAEEVAPKSTHLRQPFTQTIHDCRLPSPSHAVRPVHLGAIQVFDPVLEFF